MHTTEAAAYERHKNLKIDEQAELLDDIADLCEYWKRNRSKGRTPNAIRSALVMLAADIAKTTEPVPNATELSRATLEQDKTDAA